MSSARLYDDQAYETAIAIIGMAGRFPNAADVATFWQNIASGACSIRSFSDAELLAAGVEPALLQQPNYVKAGTLIDHVEEFDAAFFGFPPREAEVMDPQHRLFLECAWEAFEHAAYNPETHAGLVGVFAGSGSPNYAAGNLMSQPDIVEQAGWLVVHISNEPDSLASMVSYKLNLRGPSVAVQTFCSTSLVAVHLACQSLLTYECDLALAGGSAIAVPHGQGYVYQEGGIVSPDGHCRTFDANAQGSVMGSGVGAVVLKRFTEALADGDQIYAIIRGSAMNNDGMRKVGYTAPGLAGQTAVIARALSNADVSPETIDYIEAHGTATPLGDSVELAAMIKAFQRGTAKQQFCAIGSVKPNVGHLDRASGVTGLIKTSLALHHQLLPPSIDYQSPNPEIDLAGSPFYVNTTARPWPRHDTPRRAGVSSFGLGGTNVHVVLEEAPLPALGDPARPDQLLLISAKTPTALDAATANLAAYLRQHPDANLADVAYTLQVGRTTFAHRRTLVCRDLSDALSVLEAPNHARLLAAQQTSRDRPVAFLFPGVGDHYAGMARELYESEPIFRDIVEQCCAILQPHLGLDLRTLLYPEADRRPTTDDRRPTLRHEPFPVVDSPLHATTLAQPAVFVVEYALAQLLIGWGVQPAALLGYSLGEYVAACLAGVLSLEDALTLVAGRARLIAALPDGAMLAVFLSEAEIGPFLRNGVDLALVNGPTSCVLAGPTGPIAALEQALAAQSVACRRVPTSHAFHSHMLAPIADDVTALARTLTLHPPRIPYLSNVTGTWITEAQATDPAYWAQHMIQTVRFAEGVAQLLATPQACLEVGAGSALSSFVKGHPSCGRDRFSQIIATLPAAHEPSAERAAILTTLGKLWLADVPIDWHKLHANAQRRRISLPTYPFERQRFWVDLQPPPRPSSATPPRLPQIDDWFAAASWKRAIPIEPAAQQQLAERQSWLLLVDTLGVGAQLAEWLTAHNQDVVTVIPGPAFVKLGPRTYTVQADSRADYAALLRDIERQGRLPQHVVHLWSVAPPTDGHGETSSGLAQVLDHGVYSLLALTKALGDLGLDRCQISIVTSQMHEVTASESLCAAKATLIGPTRAIPVEYPNLTCRSIDLALPEIGQRAPAALIDLLALELIGGTSLEPLVALRGPHRWVETFEAVRIPAPEHPALRAGGVYLITGGLGGIGLALAEDLAARTQAKLVLLGRSPLPPRDQWPHILATHDLTSGMGRRVRIIGELEARGTEVLVLPADVADTRQIKAAIEHTIAHFGALHGVFHTAAVPATGLMQLKTPEAVAGVLAPKVQGTLALAQALRAIPLDFLVLFSSVAAITGGGPGQMDYCAANAFLDAYARRHAHEHGRTIAIGWGEWQWDAWQDGLQGFPEAARAFLIANRRAFGISFAEGMDALQRMLVRPLPHIFATTQNLALIYEASQRTSAAVALDELQAQTQARALYPRPALDTAYGAPEGELEPVVAAIWGQVLGIDAIGRQDNFFELGGNSLIGLQVATRLRQAYQVAVPLTLLFDAPTVAEMAIALEIILIDNLELLEEAEALP